jgi:hypothetical protein
MPPTIFPNSCSVGGGSGVPDLSSAKPASGHSMMTIHRMPKQDRLRRKTEIVVRAPFDASRPEGLAHCSKRHAFA